MATTTKDQAKGKFNVVGTRPIRHDGLDKVTGRAKYGADINMPGLLHGKILRSPHPHARIRSIDTSRAEALPGVKAVVTSRDFPIIESKSIDFGETQGNARMLAENCLAYNKALYKGHAVAAVAATSHYLAEEALALIDVDYEVLPAVLDVRDAMKDDAPLLHDSLTTRAVVVRFSRGSDTGVVSNIGSHIQFQRGDLEQGFAQADAIVEREYTTETVHQGYIEPHASTAFWAADGHVTVWTSTQGPFGVRSQTAATLGIPESMVKVIPMEIGGGFGGKLGSYLDAVCALLSKKSSQPVKIVMTRQEVFEASGPAASTYMWAKIGADRTGRITAAQLYLAFGAGAFPGSPVGAASNTALAPYNIDNLLVDGYDVVCNRPKVAAYRAPGSPQGAFAVESAIDELADKLGMDPVQLRLKNAVREGDRQPSGLIFPKIGCVELETAMAEHPHYNTPLEGPNRGRGVAIGNWGNGGNQSSVTITVNSDGTINLISGSVDIGGTRVAVAMQAAEVLGIAAEDVRPSVADTDSVGWTGNTGGSRTAFSTGIAAITAAEDIKRQMINRAAQIWEVQPEDVEFQGGVFSCKKNPDDRLTFKELSARLLRTGGPVTASGISNPRQIGPAFAGTIVDVEVDPETGKVQVLRCTILQDVGQAAHPSYVEGQMQGGTVQGIGWALTEGYFYGRDGVMANPTFLDYRMPTTLDVPMIEATLVEVPAPGHPFGLRGVGEVSLVPPWRPWPTLSATPPASACPTCPYPPASSWRRFKAGTAGARSLAVASGRWHDGLVGGGVWGGYRGRYAGRLVGGPRAGASAVWSPSPEEHVMSELSEMAATVGALLKQRQHTVAVAESSAGGLISAALLAVPGASAYYLGGAVVYTHAARHGLLRIPDEAMADIRASSEPYALLKARTVRESLATTWGLSETGASGPTGNRYGDAAGHTCIAVVGPVERAITLETASPDREANMWTFAKAALDLLEQCVQEAP